MRDSRRHQADTRADDGVDDAFPNHDGGEARKPSLVQRRKRSRIEITDSTVDSLSGKGDGSENLPAGSTGIFNAVGIDEVSKKIRRKRVAKIAICAAAAVAIVAVAIAVTVSGDSTEQAQEEDAEMAIDSEYAGLGFVDLPGFYGLTRDEAEDLLGPSFALESVEEEADLEDPDITYTKYTYVDSDELGDEWGDDATRVELSIGDDLLVQGVGCTVSMDRAGIDFESFDVLVETQDALQASLDAAGISDVSVTYLAPDPESYTSYLDPLAEDPEVSRYSTTFTGSTGYADLPGTWSVTFAYDYTVTDGDGVQSVVSEPDRTISVSLE